MHPRLGAHTLVGVGVLDLLGFAIFGGVDGSGSLSVVDEELGDGESELVLSSLDDVESSLYVIPI